ncbi:MAG: trypsin-like peptidase domain-containing protein [Candidatus Muiribacteriota bacterium]
MKKLFLGVFIILFIFSINALDNDLAYATVKIFNQSQSNVAYTPWEMTGVRGATGSGVVIDKGVILTNAHVVADSRFLTIQKYDDPKKYQAEVIYAGHDCDVALIDVVENRDEFYDGVTYMELGEMPQLRAKVNTIGYPTGGNKLSITEGVVSRIEYQTYSHDGFRRHLAVQTDAAINPGNSGGPVVKNGKLVGLAFQGSTRGQNIGYFIPLFVIKHFLEDIETGEYNGFPMAGFSYEELRSPTLRKYLNVSEDYGIYVKNVVKNTPAYEKLKPGDVILKIDGNKIEEDGTVKTEWGYLNKLHLLDSKHIGDEAVYTIIRNGRKKEVTLNYFHWEPSINRSSLYDRNFLYYTIAGYVFTPLSRDYLESWGSEWFRDADFHQRYYYYEFEDIDDKRDEIIVLSKVLPDPVNMYTREFENSVIEKINGRNIRHFNELVTRFENLKVKDDVDFIHIEIEGADKPIIIPKDELEQADLRIKENYNLPSLRRVK